MSTTDCDVLVVGLGPVGAMLAGLLRASGISVIAIDREAEVYPLPRAGAFDDEAMRSFQALGIAETLLPLTRAMPGMEFRSIDGDVLLRMDIPPGLGPYGWQQTYVLHQPTIERVLRDHLAARGVDIRLGTSLSGFAQSPGGISASLIGPDGASAVNAKYLVGCDGANSLVREIGGRGAFDYGFSEPWLVVDALVEDGGDLPELLTQILDPEQPTTYVHMLGDRYRWEFMLKPGDDEADFTSDEKLKQLLAPWNAGDRIRVERRALYRFRGLVAHKWRDGRAFLAGDAAHQMPPFAGQGMCSGFRDAGNLAWKLAAVISGRADEGLLDTYQDEREAHVRAIIEHSIQLGKMICMLDPAMAAQRDASLRAMRDAGQKPPPLPTPPLTGGCLLEGAGSGEMFVQPVAGDVRLDDFAGPGPWLVSRAPVIDDSIRTVSPGDGSAGRFGPQILTWLDERRADAVLVRPDRYIFGAGDPATLVAAWKEKLRTAA